MQFNNEFSWVNNKAIVLTLGQWPSRQGMEPTALGHARLESEPELEPKSGGAVGLLRSLRSGGGGGGGASMSANPMMAAPP